MDAIPASREADWFLSDYLGEPCRLVYMPHGTRRVSNPQYTGDSERLVGFADGYAFPGNLDEDQPTDGLAPPSQLARLLARLEG